MRETAETSTEAERTETPASNARSRGGASSPGLMRFLRQLAARGGVGRCYWHEHLWPAEEAGWIRARYVPVQMPRHRTRPIRQWCYEVSLTDLGWSIARAADREDRDAERVEAGEPDAPLASETER